MDMDDGEFSKKRSFRGYKICPHCDKQLNPKKLREHKRHFFDCNTKQWCRPADNNLSDDSSELSGIEFEGIDSCVELSSQPNDQPEALSQIVDFDDCFSSDSEVGSPSATAGEPRRELNKDHSEG